MTTDSKSDVKADTKKSQEGAETLVRGSGAAVSPRALITTPVVIKLGKSGKNKNKKKYTRGTKGLQRLVLGVSKAAFRSSNSVAEGLKTFVKRSNKSSRKRRDGLVREVFRNASRGFGDSLTELGKAPGELARRVGTRRVWRTFRVFTPLGR